jgi:hypothetical protein
VLAAVDVGLLHVDHHPALGPPPQALTERTAQLMPARPDIGDLDVARRLVGYT